MFLRNLKFHIYLLFSLVVNLAIFMIPISTQATVFSFDPADLRNNGRDYRPGFTFTVKFLLDTEGEKVGVVDSAVLFTSENLEVIRISTEDSTFRLWEREPRLIPNTNIIEFAGEVPGGFSGRGEIFSATFRAKTEETAHLFTLYAHALRSDLLPTELSARREEVWYPFTIPDRIQKDFVFTRNLIFEDRSLDVAYLQLVLRIEELYRGDISGRFDGITRDAVLAFQERYFEDILIPGRFDQPTGDVDFWTRAKLNRFLPSTVFEEPKPSPEQALEEPPALFDIGVSPGEQQKSSKTVTIITVATIVVAAGIAIYVLRRKKYAQ